MKEKFAISKDKLKIYYQFSDLKRTSIVFVHGWLGNSEWWKNQTNYFQEEYTVVQIDLPGHGKSERQRLKWSSTLYADDIKNVTEKIESENIILLGHSMSGPYCLQASLLIPKVKLVVLVDTLKNMDTLMDYHQAEELLFKSYKTDFNNSVKNLLPKFLFSESTSVEIRNQLQDEFLKYDSEFAVKSIEPLYRMDLREIAKDITIPVRAIHSSFTPTNIESIRKYIKDFDYVTVPESGHYPMLERPDEFNLSLLKLIRDQGL